MSAALSGSRVGAITRFCVPVFFLFLAVSGAGAQRTDYRNLTLGFEPGGPTKNGYADAQALVAYWFEECFGSIHFSARLDPRAHIVITPHRYWIDGRDVQVPPHIGPPNLSIVTLKGTLRGRRLAGPRDITFIAQPRAACADGFEVVNPRALYKADAPLHAKQAEIAELGYDDHTQLPVLRNSAVENHFRTLWAQERRDSATRVADARRDSLQRARTAKARQDSAVRTQQAGANRSDGSSAAGITGAAVAAGRATASGTPALTENGAARRYEQERLRDSVAAAERKREADAEAARIADVHRRNAERQRQTAEQVDRATTVAKGLISARLEANRVKEEREQQRRAAEYARRDALPRCGPADAREVKLGDALNGYIGTTGCSSHAGNIGNVYALQLQERLFVEATVGSDVYYAQLSVQHADGRVALPTYENPHAGKFPGAVAKGYLDAGTYYFHVSSVGDPDVGPYRFFVSNDSVTRARQPIVAALLDGSAHTRASQERKERIANVSGDVVGFATPLRPSKKDVVIPSLGARVLNHGVMTLSPLSYAVAAEALPVNQWPVPGGKYTTDKLYKDITTGKLKDTDAIRSAFAKGIVFFIRFETFRGMRGSAEISCSHWAPDGGLMTKTVGTLTFDGTQSQLVWHSRVIAPDGGNFAPGIYGVECSTEGRPFVNRTYDIF